MTEIVKPHNIEAEAALIGSVLIDPPAFFDVGDICPGDFYLVQHKWLWAALQKLVEGKREIDNISLATCLKSQNQLDEIGGPAYITRLIDNNTSAYHATTYAAIVRECKERRDLIRLASEIAKGAFDETRPLSDTRSVAMSALVSAMRITGQATPIKFFVSQLYDVVKARADDPREYAGLPTGFKDYDYVTDGLMPGEITVLAGEPGSGKSLFAGQVAMQMSRAQIPGAVYELEMSAQQIVTRLIGADGGPEARKMKTGKMDDHDWEAFTRFMGQADDLPFYLSEATHWSTASLRADLARLKVLAGIQWFVLDYMNLLTDRSGKDENERMTYISRQLKAICKDLNLAGLLIQSLNKGGMSGATDKSMRDIRGSGQIAFDADVICFITDHIPRDGERPNENLSTLTFAKFREGEPHQQIDLVRRPGLPAFGDCAVTVESQGSK